MTRADIIVLSDVHWGASDSLHEEFKDFLTSFLERRNTKHLVLLGDIVDFWRMNKEECFRTGWELEKPLSLIMERGYAKRIHYVIGNHDCNFNSMMGPAVYDLNIRKTLRLRSGGRKFFFIHGHQLEYRRIRKLFDWIACPFLVGVGGTIIGRQLDSVWMYFDKKLRPRIRRSIEWLKSKINPSIMKLNLTEINRLVELLYLNTLGPHEIKMLANHMIAPLNQRISMPLVGKDFFAAQEWTGAQIEDKPRMISEKRGIYDPTSFYLSLISKDKKRGFPISPDDALKNIIGPIDFSVVLRRKDIERIDREEWTLKEEVFQLLDAILLLGNSLYEMKDSKAVAFLEEMILNIIRGFHYRDPYEFLRKGLLQFQEKSSERISWVNLQEKIVEEIVDVVSSNTGGIVERAESTLGLRNDETLVYGHTHMPFRSDRLINTGSWMRFEDRDSKTYFIIDRGQIDGPLVFQ